MQGPILSKHHLTRLKSPLQPRRWDFRFAPTSCKESPSVKEFCLISDSLALWNPPSMVHFAEFYRARCFGSNRAMDIIQCQEMVKVACVLKGVVRGIKADQRFFNSITAGRFHQRAFSFHFRNNMCPDLLFYGRQSSLQNV